MRVGRAIGLLAGALSVCARARADPVPSLNLRGFHPPTDPEGDFYLEPTRTPGPLAWNAGAWISYAHRLVSVRDAAGSEVAVPVERQLSVDYLFGLGLGKRWSVGIGMPTVMYERGHGQAVAGGGALPTIALGDLELSTKASVLNHPEVGGFGLALVGRASLPTGNRSTYVAESAVTGELRLLGELQVLALTLRATAGAKARGAEQDFVGARFGHELPWGAELVIQPRQLGIDPQGHWQCSAESRGAVALTPSVGSRAQSPAYFGLTARYAIEDFSLTVGGELPLDNAVGAPDWRGALRVDWAPRKHDADDDGIRDDVDQCPQFAEDKDGFQDTDGCPDADNDADGIPDAVDACPNEKEDRDGFQDEDGCPDPDNDGDGIPDLVDACPQKPGIAAADLTQNGCKPRDTDGDGLLDPNDRCPTQAEDKDGFQDDDGCPDPDNDADGVPDATDACPNESGPSDPDPTLNGCPSRAHDGDTGNDAPDR